MSYADIPGRAAYLWIYDEFLDAAPQGAIIVEVGVALGKSLAYLVDRAIAKGRHDVEIFAVDSWAGTARNGEQQAAGEATPDGDWFLFLDTVRQHEPRVFTRANIVRKTSVDAALSFERGGRGVDLVVLDAAHDYASVKEDIAHWRRALRPNAWMGGDDYMPDFPGVIDAVHEAYDGRTVDVHHDEGWGTWLVRGAK